MIKARVIEQLQLTVVTNSITGEVVMCVARRGARAASSVFYCPPHALPPLLPNPRRSGSFQLSVDYFKTGAVHENWFRLHGAGGEDCGEIHLRGQLMHGGERPLGPEDFDAPPPHMQQQMQQPQMQQPQMQQPAPMQVPASAPAQPTIVNK